MKVVAIIMNKGGSAKTTTAVNIAASAALAGKRTLLVDLDPQGNATSGVGYDIREVTTGVNDLFHQPDLDPKTVILPTDIGGLDVLAGGPALAATMMNMQPEHVFLVREG